MFITPEICLKYGISKNNIQVLLSEYPKGTEFQSILDNHNLDDFAHEAFLKLPLDEADQNKYLEKMNIENSTGVFYSSFVNKGESILRSSQVTESSQVYDSYSVINSKLIKSSRVIKNSSLVENSTLVTESYGVKDSKTVNHSSIVADSSFIIDSCDIIKSSGVDNSIYVFNSESIDDSQMILNCRALKNCAFCSNLEDKEFYLFNKPIKEKMMKMIQAQFVELFNRELKVIEGIEFMYNIHLNTFSSIQSDLFWEWVKTLPGYDEIIMYSLTIDKRAFDLK